MNAYEGPRAGKCDRWRDLILLDAEGTLPASDRDGLWQHLSGCAACRRYAGEVRAVLSVLSGEASPLPGGLERRLVDLAGGVRVRAARWRMMRYRAAAAAVLLVSAALAVLLLAPRRDRPGPGGFPDLTGIEIDRDLAAIARAVQRLAQPIELAWNGHPAVGPSGTATQPLAPRPAHTPVMRKSFDDELHRIGSAIEALDRPIFEEAMWNEGGGNG